MVAIWEMEKLDKLKINYILIRTRMNILIGIIIATAGISLSALGVKMFIKSQNWFYMFKAILVILVGLMIFGLSFDNKLELLF
jgi:hypothetical protein